MIHCYYCCFKRSYILDQLRIRKVKIFYFTCIYSFSDIIFFFMQKYISDLYHFIYACRTSFIIFCRAGLLVVNSHCFCLFEKLLSLSLLKNNFTGYRILGWWVFSFNISNIPLHSLLACPVYTGKPSVTHLSVSL